MTHSTEAILEAAESKVKEKSAVLKKELSLFDLVLTQVLYITGLGWLGTAAKMGSSHVFFWLPAVLLFYIPSAVVVIHLTREMPIEGGLYQWAKLRFGDLVGFLVAWNLWLFTVLVISELGVVTANNVSYAAGPSGAWIAENKTMILATSLVFVISLAAVAIRGLALGKWFHNIGSLTLIAIFGAMLLLAIPRWITGSAAMAPIPLSFPALTLFNLNILGKMSFGALGGCDGTAIFAGECQDPQVARTLRLSVWIAAPFVATIFTVGTACILAYTVPGALDLVSPVAQNLNRAAMWYGIAGPVVPLVMLLMLISRIGSGVMMLNAVSRLPLVAGWDDLLPAWFTRLHPIYKTPMWSILFVAAMVLVFAFLSNSGVGSQEAFQLLNNGAGISYALTYLVMFAIPLAAPGEKPSLGVRMAAASGFLMTLLYVVLSVFPIIDVENAGAFTRKICGVVVASNLLGAGFYWNARKRQQRIDKHRV